MPSGLYPKTAEHRLKISRSLMGKKQSQEQIRNAALTRIGKRRTSEQRAKMSGPNCHLWRGGITSVNKMARECWEYDEWRRSVFKRDNYQCVIGGKDHGNKLQADHIKSFSQYPDLRYVVSNGRTLCEDCHKKTDNYGSKALKVTGKKIEYEK